MAELKDLLVSGRELDEALVASVLKPVLRIDEETAGIRPQGGWRKASNEAKILSYLLARKAMTALGLEIGQEAASPREIIAATGLPRGSVHPTLKALYERRPQAVERDSASRYWVPNWAVDEACSIIGRSVGE